MTTLHSGDPIPLADHRRARAEAIERGSSTGLDVAALLTGTKGGATHGQSPATAADTPAAAAPAITDAEQLATAITTVANGFLAQPIDADTDFFEGGATSVAA